MSIPGIMQFLGYDPFPEPKTLRQYLLAKRQAMGWSIKQAAEVVGVDPSTWRNWERGQAILYHQYRALVARLLDLSIDDLDHEMASCQTGSHERASRADLE